MAKRVYVLKLRTKLIIVMLLLGYFLSTMIQQEWEMHNQQMQISGLEQEVSQAQHDNEILSRQIEHTESDDYIEQAARDRLGWVKDGETIFIEKKGE